jgi:hypothetical protein
MVALVNILYEPWYALGFERVGRASPLDASAQVAGSSPTVVQQSASSSADQPVPGGAVTATAPEADASATATGSDDRDVQDAAAHPDSPGHEEEEVPPVEPQRDCFGGRAAADLLKMTTRWNKRYAQQIRSLQLKQLTSFVSFVAGENEDAPIESKVCKAVVVQVPAEPKPEPHSVVVPGTHVWAFFDSALAIVHLSHARMVSGKNM